MKSGRRSGAGNQTGHVLDTGPGYCEPLSPIREVPVPASDIPGEDLWPTQPLIESPVAFVRQSISENELNPYSRDLDSLKAVYRKLKKGVYAPPSKEGTLVVPGIDGGAEWGGAAVDPKGIMFVNANESPGFSPWLMLQKTMSSTNDSWRKIVCQQLPFLHAPAQG